MARFSVLMSLYIKETSSNLTACFESLLEQTLQADEIVLVFDGPIGDSLKSVVDKWSNLLPLNIIPLKRNVGLGNALNYGLKYCKHDLVARVDTDDINLPERFKIQYDYMQLHLNVDLISSHVAEFSLYHKDITGKRKVPLGDDIVSKIYIRNPINHMATMFRKQSVLQSGNYKHFPNMEDYYLWIRMHENGFVIDNIDQVLVLARTGDSMLLRRRGWSYCKTEIKFMLMLLGMKRAKNKPKIMFVYFIRAFIRLLPKKLLAKFYEKTRN